MATLNEQYYAEGWGWLIKGALGIEPEYAEAQARAVAKYADKMIDQTEARANENERALEEALEDARNEVEAADEGRRAAEDRIKDLEYELREAFERGERSQMDNPR